MTEDIVAFIAARLDEDEAIAKAATHRAFRKWHAEPWHDGNFLKDGRAESADLWDSTGGQHTQGHGALFRVTAEHIARHDPARVLREVEAKRAILGRHKPGGDLADYDYGSAPCMEDEHLWPCGTLRLLAAVWDDHPDYRAEWKR